MELKKLESLSEGKSPEFSKAKTQLNLAMQDIYRALQLLEKVESRLSGKDLTVYLESAGFPKTETAAAIKAAASAVKQIKQTSDEIGELQMAFDITESVNESVSSFADREKFFGVPLKKMSVAQWYGFLKKIDRLTPAKFKDVDYLADRIKVHADEEDVVLNFKALAAQVSAYDAVRRLDSKKTTK